MCTASPASSHVKCAMAMQELAGAYPASDIGAEAYRLFKEFRPTPGQAGAGRARKGTLRLERLRELAAEASLRYVVLGLG